MADLAATAAEVYSDFVTPGVASSGEKEPEKAEIRALWAQCEALILAIQEGGSGAYVLFQDVADINADLDHPAGTWGRVIADDGSPSGNGYYLKSGASGAGAWAFITQDPAVTAAALAEADADRAEAAAESVEAIANLIGTESIGPIAITGAGTDVTTTATVFYWPQMESDRDRWVTAIELGVSARGLVEIFVVTNNGDSTLDFVSSEIIETPGVGAVTVDGLRIFVPAGAIAGVRNLSGAIVYTPGGNPGAAPEWASEIPTDNTAIAIYTSNGVQFRFDVADELIFKARAAYDAALDLEETVGEDLELGWADPIVGTGTATPGSYTIAFPEPAPSDGAVTRVIAGALAAGTMRLYALTVDRGPAPEQVTVTAVRFIELTLVDGVADLAVNFPVNEGELVAVGRGGYAFQNAVNPTGGSVYVLNADPNVDTALQISQTHRYEVQVHLSSGLVLGVARAESGGSNDGLSLLATVDNTGGTDVTTEFADAVAAHEAPYVPPGVFALTEMPRLGDGFWGPGRPVVDGRRWFIKQSPERGSLQQAFRQALADVMFAGDVLTLVADSIGHWAYADTGPQHWFNQTGYFANALVAPGDEPILANLRPQLSYDPSFYGVTFSGTAVSTGANGPLDDMSAIMAPGSIATFVGPLEHVDVFAQRAVGAGSLVLKRAGVTLATWSYNGAAASDHMNGIDTGNPASATYTLECTGANVELTAINRLGPKVAGSGMRLRTFRAAHGSWTAGYFDQPNVDSIVRIASYAGGVPAPLIALGINDSRSQSLATIESSFNDLIDKFEAAGSTRFFGVLPIRPDPAIWPDPVGYPLDEGIAVIRKVYRERGVVQIPGDCIDFTARGWFSDGLHPGGQGQEPYAQLVIENIARSV
jgi:hypothetical protein